MIGKLLKLYRAANDFGVRDIAHQLDISASTVTRIEQGENVDQATMLKLITWLFYKP